jgi:hypothetical protein
VRKKEIPDVVKKTTRTGRRIGAKDRCKVSLTLNDPDRVISRLWETVKKYYSGQHETAAETAARVVMNGLLMENEKIILSQAAERKEQQEQLQGSLF